MCDQPSRSLPSACFIPKREEMDSAIITRGKAANFWKNSLFSLAHTHNSHGKTGYKILRFLSFKGSQSFFTFLEHHLHCTCWQEMGKLTDCTRSEVHAERSWAVFTLQPFIKITNCSLIINYCFKCCYLWLKCMVYSERQSFGKRSFRFFIKGGLVHWKDTFRQIWLQNWALLWCGLGQET